MVGVRVWATRIDFVDASEAQYFAQFKSCYFAILVYSYLIFVIFFTRARFLETKFYTQKHINKDKTDFATK